MTKDFGFGASSTKKAPASLSVTLDSLEDGEARLSITAGSDPLCVTLRVTLRPGQSVDVPRLRSTLIIEEQ